MASRSPEHAPFTAVCLRLAPQLLSTDGHSKLVGPAHLLRMEFTTFVNAFIQLPCQIVRTGRPIVYRLLSRNPWQHVFLRLIERLQGRQLC